MDVYYGEYFGNGWSDSGSGSYSSPRYASSTNLRTISQDVASKYSDYFNKIRVYSQRGESTEAINEYKQLFNCAKANVEMRGYDLDDGEIRSIINNAYYTLAEENLMDTMTQSTDNDFWTGFLRKIPIVRDYVHTNSSEDVIKAVSGEKTSEKSKKLKNDGGLVADTCMTTAAGVTVGAVVKSALNEKGIVRKIASGTYKLVTENWKSGWKIALAAGAAMVAYFLFARPKSED